MKCDHCNKTMYFCMCDKPVNEIMRKIDDLIMKYTVVEYELSELKKQIEFIMKELKTGK